MRLALLMLKRTIAIQSVGSSSSRTVNAQPYEPTYTRLEQREVTDQDLLPSMTVRCLIELRAGAGESACHGSRCARSGIAPMHKKHDSAHIGHCPSTSVSHITVDSRTLPFLTHLDIGKRLDGVDVGLVMHVNLMMDKVRPVYGPPHGRAALLSGQEVRSVHRSSNWIPSSSVKSSHVSNHYPPLPRCYISISSAT